MHDGGSAALVSGDEVLLCNQRGVGIYEKEVKSPLQNGRISLSTHAIFFQEEGSTELLSLDLSLVQPPVSRLSGIGWSHPKIVCTLKNGFYFKFSFRAGGIEAFFAALTNALEKKLWTIVTPKVSHAKQNAGLAQCSEMPERQTGEPPSATFTFTDRAGIAGVIRQQPQREDLAEAMNDINAVMINAGALVAAIRKFKSQSGVTPEDASAIVSVEEALGLGSVVTARSIGKGARWHEEVCREVVRWLSVEANPLSKAVIIPLVELFSHYNRARRQELVSPQDLVEACRLISSVMPSSCFTLKVFRSGAQALANGSAGNVESLLRRALGPKPTSISGVRSLTGLSASQFAALLGTNDDIAEEVLEDFEEDELLCRSESTFGQVTYFWNVFL